MPWKVFCQWLEWHGKQSAFISGRQRQYRVGPVEPWMWKPDVCRWFVEKNFAFSYTFPLCLKSLFFCLFLDLQPPFLTTSSHPHPCYIVTLLVVSCLLGPGQRKGRGTFGCFGRKPRILRQSKVEQPWTGLGHFSSFLLCFTWETIHHFAVLGLYLFYFELCLGIKIIGPGVIA